MGTRPVLNIAQCNLGCLFGIVYMCTLQVMHCGKSPFESKMKNLMYLRYMLAVADLGLSFQVFIVLHCFLEKLINILYKNAEIKKRNTDN